MSWQYTRSLYAIPNLPGGIAHTNLWDMLPPKHTDTGGPVLK